MEIKHLLEQYIIDQETITALRNELQNLIENKTEESVVKALETIALYESIKNE